jgi:hypothetical protein
MKSKWSSISSCGMRELSASLTLPAQESQWAEGGRGFAALSRLHLFCSGPRSERVKVLQAPCVLAIAVGAAGDGPVGGAEVEAASAGLALRPDEPRRFLTTGRRGRVRAGAVTGLESIMARRKNNLLMVLTMDLILLTVAVEADGEEPEAVDRCG